MADGESVLADHVSIKKLGEKLIEWSQDIDRVIPKAENAFITPGHVWPSGPELKKRFSTRVNTDLVAILTKLRDSLYDMGVELGKMSTVYATVEDLNKDDLSRLEGIIKSVKKAFPDFNPISKPDLSEL